jgi:hypothetical protein
LMKQCEYPYFEEFQRWMKNRSCILHFKTPELYDALVSHGILITTS